jgi:hypothetical protein
MFTPAVNDPTAAILRCAAARQMQVYVGLWEDPSFKPVNINDTDLGEAARKSAEVVDSMRARGYANSTSFAGCYASLEPRESRRLALYRGYAAYASVSTGPCPVHH